MLELRGFVDDVDDVGALAATRIAEVDGVNAQKAGPAVRPRGLRRTPKPTGVDRVSRKVRRPVRYARLLRRL